MPPPPRSIPRLGLAVWLVLPALRRADLGQEAPLAEVVVLFVPLVAAPLALAQIAPGDMSEETSMSARLGARLPALAALAALAAALPTARPDLAPGLAAALTLPWLLVCGLAAVLGLVRLRARARRLDLAELPLDLALLWLPGAAVWLLVYRGDWILGGFGGLAALLTAGHFHAAGFGALVMVGLLGRALAGASPHWARRAHALAAIALLLAFPLLAAGIGAGVRPVELAGAGLYVLALPVLALLQLVAAVHLRDRPAPARVLLALSAGSLLLSTSFAARYAAQGFYGAAVPIATMLRVHGLVNALGFLGLGLAGWRALARRKTSAAP